jgi:hypothetical protein
VLNTRPTHQPNLFFLVFFKYVFGRFSARGVQKYHKLFPKNRPKFRCHFSAFYFYFIAASGVSQRCEFRKHFKTRFAKEIVSKSFYKEFDQKSKTNDFSVRRVQKHPKKYQQFKSDPFLSSALPARRGPPICFGGPLAVGCQLSDTRRFISPPLQVWALAFGEESAHVRCVSAAHMYTCSQCCGGKT